MSNNVNLKLNEKEVRKILTDILKEGNAIIVDCLIAHYKENQFNRETLIKACLKMKPEYKFKVGEQIIFESDYAYIWNADKNLMEKKSLIKDKTMIGKIIEVNKFVEYPYLVQLYSCKADGKLLLSTANLIEEHIKTYLEDFVGDDILPGEPVNLDMPF